LHLILRFTEGIEE